MPVLIHLLAAAEFDPAQFAAKPSLFETIYRCIGNNARPKSGFFLQFFQSARDQRRAHRIEGEHEETSTSNASGVSIGSKDGNPADRASQSESKT
jgi:hypothetical protein